MTTRAPQEDIIAAVNTSTHVHGADFTTIEKAMRAVARDADGIIDPNLVRERLTGPGGELVVYPRALSARYSRLRQLGVIERAGTTTNRDRRGGNAGKPMHLYRVADEKWLHADDEPALPAPEGPVPAVDLGERAARYAEFIASKSQHTGGDGFAAESLPGSLFPFQEHLVEWALRRGRAGIFADCGLGKTLMELAWATEVHKHTGKPVLLLTPLAVGFQIVGEAEKFGFDAQMSRVGRPAAPVTVTNYEQLHKFDTRQFGGVVCDESSAIKAFDGQTRAIVTEFMREHRFRLLGTATAAPNDFIELGTSSEALGELGHMDMLGRFFTNKQRTTSSRGRGLHADQVKWRLKGHAEQAFWRWVASWARAVRHPRDLGFDDDRFTLPDLHVDTTVVEARTPSPEFLFDMPANGLREEREETRRTLQERCEAAAEKLADAETGVAWCQLNDESTALAKLIDGAVEVTGSDSPEAKEEKLAAFSRGDIRVLVTKPSIGAWGLNWQHCHRMTYFPSHSYEQYYQALRRSWRFGQRNDVHVDLITTEGGRGILANLQRKAEQADRMFAALVEHMNDAATPEVARYETRIEVPAWLV
ncbi:hypothetical protein ACUXNS_000079 [Brevibacterium pityocampae]